MRVDFHGLQFETPRVTIHLFSPWRCSALEHRLFEAVRALPRTETERAADEWRIHLTEPKSWRAAMQAMSRVMKGWQEEAEAGTERRSWHWLIEGDTNADGYDHYGEPISLWAFFRASLERGGPDDGEKAEDIDLEGFSVRIWGENGTGRGPSN